RRRLRPPKRRRYCAGVSATRRRNRREKKLASWSPASSATASTGSSPAANSGTWRGVRASIGRDCRVFRHHRLQPLPVRARPVDPTAAGAQRELRLLGGHARRQATGDVAAFGGPQQGIALEAAAERADALAQAEVRDDLAQLLFSRACP